MRYKMENLVPIVAKLAEGYTSKESTSITYERAGQLMGAVLYCLHEGEKSESFSLIRDGEQSYEKMYEIGVRCVEEKTKEALELYNEVMAHFSSYGNKCLYDTVAKGLPEFFKWYNIKYEPQNTILTLDYPVLMDIPGHTGIDKIYDFIICIQLEQKFLDRFPPEYIVEALSKYDSNYRLMIDNICEIVLTNVIIRILAGKDISDPFLEARELERLQEDIQMEELGDLRNKLKKVINSMTEQYYEGDERLTEYLYKAVDNISVRIKNAAENGNFKRIMEEDDRVI